MEAIAADLPLNEPFVVNTSKISKYVSFQEGKVFQNLLYFISGEIYLFANFSSFYHAVRKIAIS